MNVPLPHPFSSPPPPLVIPFFLLLSSCTSLCSSTSCLLSFLILLYFAFSCLLSNLRHPEFFICTSSSLPLLSSHLPTSYILLQSFRTSSSSSHPPICLCTPSSALHRLFFTIPPSVSLLFPPTLPLQRPTAAGARCLPICPQHQQRCRVRPSQLLPRGGHPQHIPCRPAAGSPGPAGLRLPRWACIPIAVTWQQSGPEDTWRHGDFQQVHIQVCTQVSEKRGKSMGKREGLIVKLYCVVALLARKRKEAKRQIGRSLVNALQSW